MAIVGIVPAAGYATRLQPLDRSKEVVPIAGRPVMDFVIERMRRAPCDELRVVTRPEKADVIENAVRQGATVIEARPRTLAESVLAAIATLRDDDLALLGFPDTLWEPLDGFRRVIALLGDGWRVALGLFRGGDMRRYEPVIADATGRVARIELKPERPSSDWTWGCAAARVEVLRGLRDVDEPGALFASLSDRGVVAGVRLSDTYLDVGTRGALRRAERSPPVRR